MYEIKKSQIGIVDPKEVGPCFVWVFRAFNISSHQQATSSIDCGEDVLLYHNFKQMYEIAATLLSTDTNSNLAT